MQTVLASLVAIAAFGCFKAIKAHRAVRRLQAEIVTLRLSGDLTDAVRAAHAVPTAKGGLSLDDAIRKLGGAPFNAVAETHAMGAAALAPTPESIAVARAFKRREARLKFAELLKPRILRDIAVKVL